jgi:hypothetical protein
MVSPERLAKLVRDIGAEMNLSAHSSSLKFSEDALVRLEALDWDVQPVQHPAVGR